MTKYLHTINGIAAEFDGDQICFASFHGPALKLEDSLDAIKKNIAWTKKWRESQGFDFVASQYSWRRVDA